MYLGTKELLQSTAYSDFSRLFFRCKSLAIATIPPACPEPTATCSLENLYHLTHRCHDRQFLFKLAKDRNRYRQIMWESLYHSAVEVFSYCVTSDPHAFPGAKRRTTTWRSA